MALRDAGIGYRHRFTDEFVRAAAVVTERREGEFDVPGQTWRYIPGTAREGVFGSKVISRLYERVR